MAQRVTPPMDPEAVGELVRRSLGDGPSSATRLAQRERLVRATTASTRAPSRWAFAAAVAIASVVVAALVVLRPWSSTELPAVVADSEPEASEWFAAPAGGKVDVDIGDGTRLQLVDGARGRMTRGTDTAQLVLETGRLEAEVEPRANRRWTIEAGPYRVRVVGTIFTVDWDPATGRLDVEVQRGKVEVVGPGSGSPIPVDAGHRLRASLPEATAELGAIADARTHDDEVPEIIEEPDVADVPTDPVTGARKKKTVDAAPTWQSLARAGKYAESFATADASGWDALLQRSDRDTLELLADTARLSKHPTQAAKAYERVRTRFAGTAAAARAAFQLGRLAADRGGDSRAAAKWFRLSLAEAPKGAFAEQARGRLVQALHAAGDVDGARAAAREYVDRHPDGPHAKLARSLLPP